MGQLAIQRKVLELLGGHGDHRIQAQEQEIGKVIAGQPLAGEMSVDAAQTAKTAFAGPQPSPIR